MVKLFYHDNFDLEMESISLRKHKLVRDRLLNEGIVAEESITEAKPLTMNDLLLVHTKEYVNAVKTGEPLQLAESNGIKWGKDVYERALYSLGSVYQSLESALKYGISGSLASGYHHTHSPEPHEIGLFDTSFCTFSYIIPIKKLMLEKKIESALIVDCDVHHPDGTEDPVGDKGRVDLLKFDETNYSRNKISELLGHVRFSGDNADYYKYEAILEHLIGELIDGRKPDVILYRAGQDSFNLGAFNNLKLTIENLFERDQFMFRYARLNRIPIAFTIGSGYSWPMDVSVNGHVNTVKAALNVEKEPYRIDTSDWELSTIRDEEMSKKISEGKIYFVEKMINRFDRISNRKMCAGKVFNTHSETFYYDINNKWDINYCMDGIGLEVLNRNLIDEKEFRKMCKEKNILKFIENAVIKIDDEGHMHKELGTLKFLFGPEFEN